MSDPLRSAANAADKAREWTAKRDDAIRAALAAGHSSREVAVACGLSHVGVQKVGRRVTEPPR